MKRRLLTRPQYHLLKRLSECDFGEARLASGVDRRMARRLGQLDCVRKGEEYWWFITDHGYNILDLHRSFYEPANPQGEDRDG